jgi:hypothetical protein
VSADAKSDAITSARQTCLKKDRNAGRAPTTMRGQHAASRNGRAVHSLSPSNHKQFRYLGLLFKSLIPSIVHRDMYNIW